MLNCQQATRLMSAAMEHPLKTRDALALKLHLLMCGGCRQFDQQLHWLRGVARSYAQGGDQAARGEPGTQDFADRQDGTD